MKSGSKVRSKSVVGRRSKKPTDSVLKDKKVLIVDDDDVCCVGLKRVLADLGIQASSANSGRQGLKEIKKGTFDLVLLDVMMPDLDGWEVAKMLRTGKNYPDVRLLFMTGLIDYSQAKWLNNCESDRDKIFSKTCSPDELLAMMESSFKEVDSKPKKKATVSLTS
ncbi:MAG: response regulator [Verrucomicrobiota bacterium]